MNKISIIVPVYNVEKYIKRCVDSLLEQTYSDIEIILVDDGAKDNSGSLCDDLAKNDDRIKVFHKENGGLSSARNYGIEKATGDYVCFVDSDDYVSPDYCRKMIEVSQSENADIVVCNYIRFSGERCTESIDSTDAYQVFNRVDALKNLYALDGERYTLAWNKLYKRSVIADIRYPESLINEDEFTTYKFLLNADKIVTMDDVLYFYFKNDNSITTNAKYLENLDVFKALEERRGILEKRSDMSEVLKLHDKTYLNRIIFRNRDLIKINKNMYKDLLGKYRGYYSKVKGHVKGVGYAIYYCCPAFYYYLVDKRK